MAATYGPEDVPVIEDDPEPPPARPTEGDEPPPEPTEPPPTEGESD